MAKLTAGYNDCNGSIYITHWLHYQDCYIVTLLTCLEVLLVQKCAQHKKEFRQYTFSVSLQRS